MDGITLALGVAQGLSLISGAEAKKDAYEEAYLSAIKTGQEYAAQIRLEGSIKADEMIYKAKLLEGINTSKMAGQQAPLTGSALDVIMQESRHADLNVALTEYEYNMKANNAIKEAIKTATGISKASDALFTETFSSLVQTGFGTQDRLETKTMRKEILAARQKGMTEVSEAQIKAAQAKSEQMYGTPFTPMPSTDLKTSLLQGLTNR